MHLSASPHRLALTGPRSLLQPVPAAGALAGAFGGFAQVLPICARVSMPCPSLCLSLCVSLSLCLPLSLPPSLSASLSFCLPLDVSLAEWSRWRVHIHPHARTHACTHARASISKS